VRVPPASLGAFRPRIYTPSDIQASLKTATTYAGGILGYMEEL
jgi:hypothetical protein